MRRDKVAVHIMVPDQEAMTKLGLDLVHEIIGISKLFNAQLNLDHDIIVPKTR